MLPCATLLLTCPIPTQIKRLSILFNNYHCIRNNSMCFPLLTVALPFFTSWADFTALRGSFLIGSNWSASRNKLNCDYVNCPQPTTDSLSIPTRDKGHDNEIKSMPHYRSCPVRTLLNGGCYSDFQQSVYVLILLLFLNFRSAFDCLCLRFIYPHFGFGYCS